ncbi:MAG: MBOAT family protein, partial [Deltaproteobacteria bacterium]|nr:MBOAT family protein [Deltaproteobacteria bacterium]
MLFTSFTFLLFHLAVVALRWLLPGRAAPSLLLVASLAFYLSWEPLYGLLLGGATAVAWVAGLLIERGPARRGRIVVVSIATLLAGLAWFKYAGLVRTGLVALLGAVGSGARVPELSIVLPLAISFFTFELVSYVVDVSRGEPAERSFARLLLWASYYPHLIAGPIVRAHELLPALRDEVRFDADQISEGVGIALAGLAKKVILADNLAVLADQVFAAPGKHSTFGVWLGVLAYTGQIYCDFSGYTDIARGASLTLGYRLPDNFDLPYLSRSPAEFWRRWHMTLSRWLRDYLYVSLGGNRGGRVATYRNLLLTMLLGGLWHGASLTFVAWGGLHGLALAVHRAWSERVQRSTVGALLAGSRAYAAAGWLLTMLVVVAGWVLFRAPTFGVAAELFGRMVQASPGLGE